LNSAEPFRNPNLDIEPFSAPKTKFGNLQGRTDDTKFMNQLQMNAPTPFIEFDLSGSPLTKHFKENDTYARKLIFEKLKSPIKMPNVLGTPNRARERFQSCNDEKETETETSNHKLRSTKSCTQKERLAKIQIKGDQDKSPEISPYRSKTGIFQKKEGYGKELRNSLKHSFTDDDVVFARNLDTGQLVKIEEINIFGRPTRDLENEMKIFARNSSNVNGYHKRGNSSYSSYETCNDSKINLPPYSKKDSITDDQVTYIYDLDKREYVTVHELKQKEALKKV
jgi:hypothetical protein